MELKFTLAGISAVMTLTGYYFYLHDIFAGKTKPHAYTWLVWASLTAIGFAGQLSDNGGVGAYITGLTAFVSFIIFFLAVFKYGEPNITRSDKLTLAAAAITLVLWIITDRPLVAIILISIIDFLGFVPTIRKSWTKPFEETKSSYVFAGTKFILAIIALEHYSLVTVLYPASLVVANIIFVILLTVRRSAVRN